MVHILSLDDELEMGMLIDLILDRKGYDLTYTDDSFEAWALLQTQTFDLFTQDLMRPDIDGWAFYERLCADERLQHLPMVIITAKAKGDWLLDKTVDGYLTKPFGPQELLEIVAKVLRERGIAVPTPRSGKDAPQPWVDPRKKETAPLLAGLRSANPETRFWAARDLGLLQDVQATDPLLSLLDDADDNVRWAAALALGRLEAPPAVTPLRAALGDPVPLVRMMAAHALGMIGVAEAEPPLITYLETHLDDQDPWECLSVTHTLAQIASPSATPTLVRALHHPVTEEKRMAARALGQIGEPALAGLIAHLDDTDPLVRQAAVAGLAQRPRNARVVQALIAALRDEDSEVRRSAAWMLGRSRSQRAVRPLLPLLQDPDVAVVKAAVYALGWLEAVPAIDPLFEMLGDPAHPLREEAARALSRIGGQACDLLEKQLTTGDRDTRQTVLSGIAWIRDEARAIDFYITGLQDEDAGVRRLAAQRLGWRQENRAIPALLAALRDGSPDVVAVAVSALGYLKAAPALPALKAVVARDTRQTEDGTPVADVARRAISTIEGALEEKQAPGGE
jgi:HEAT repeat protein